MPEPEIDLLAVQRGAVTAPAGCGKTHLIADSLRQHRGDKPTLILTHTNAGVAALRSRLNNFKVPPKTYRLSTIDGWAMRLTALFPTRSGGAHEHLRLESPRTDYPAIRNGATRILGGRHVDDILSATYAGLIVDEYQDCIESQHRLISCAARTLRTCVLGDPMQAIFGFGGENLAPWDAVCAQFPIVGELTTPWRWKNAGADELGLWLLNVRSRLLQRKGIDLRGAPDSVHWVELAGSADDHRRRLAAAAARPMNVNGSVLIIGDSTNPGSHRQLASQIAGATTVEAVDLKDFVQFARTFTIGAPTALSLLLQFAQSVMTNVGPQDLLNRLRVITAGTARKQPTDVESCAIRFLKKRTHDAAAELLVEISREAGVRVYRPTVLRSAVKALQASSNGTGSLYEAAVRMREENRLVGRALPKRAVGSTLLLKGLEADVAVILNADILNAQNLYVAMTRGSTGLVVCSRSPILGDR